MRLTPRRLFSALCMFVCVVITLFSCNVKVGHQKMRRRNLPIATDTITPLDNRTFIIAPYYEPRLGRLVKVIALIHHTVNELYCIFHCSSNHVVSVRARIEKHGGRFSMSYGVTDLMCEEPSECDYTYMSFTSPISTNTSQNLLFEVRNRPPPPISSNFTVCIPTLFGNFSNVLQMIQSIEMYKILGASRVTIYNTSCSRDVDKALRHYIDEGTLEVVPWPIDRCLRASKEWLPSIDPAGGIGYFAETATLNDCLYRNMYTSRFVLLHDIDEIILPVIDRDWSSLMERLQREHPGTSAFVAQNHMFPASVYTSGFHLWPHVPGVNILRHGLRKPVSKTYFTGAKIIVNPRDIFQTSIHYPAKYRGNKDLISPDIIMVFHCRPCKNKVITEELVPDDTLRRHNMSLVPNVDRVVQKLFPEL